MQRSAEATCPQAVLIANPDAAFVTQLRGHLHAPRFTVTTATTADDALALVSRHRPDAVVLGPDLTTGESRRLVQRLRADASLRWIRCLLVTEPGDAPHSLEAGADASAPRGEDPALLVARLEALLRRPRASISGVMPSLLARKRILAIDDDAAYLESLVESLASDEFEVLGAANGSAGLAALASAKVDCVLLDVVLPDLSGLDFCGAVRERPEWREIPVLMLTSSTDRAVTLACFDAGADDFVDKLAHVDLLKARIRAQLRRRNMEEESRRVRERIASGDAAAAAAQRATEAKSVFLANMSHEMRTPLNSIIGFAELLVSGEVQPGMPEHAEFLRDILESGRFLHRIVDEVLDLAKVEAGKLRFFPAETDLNRLFGEVAAMLRPLADSKQIALRCTHASGALTVRTDPLRLKQVVLNYASNAIKLSPAGSVVELRTRLSDGASFRVDVVDHAGGVDADDIPRLFQEFQQLDTGMRRQGTGLGLALTKRLVEAQGGTVGVESRPGVGSTFYAVLPLEPRGRTAETPPPPP